MGKFLNKLKFNPAAKMSIMGSYKTLKKHDVSDNNAIPNDVPKGHLVVYVGDGLKRFVIQLAFLHHPLVQDLLDQASQEYGFSHNSKLCIPCDELSFHNILRCIAAQPRSKPLCRCPCF